MIITIMDFTTGKAKLRYPTNTVPILFLLCNSNLHNELWMGMMEIAHSFLLMSVVACHVNVHVNE